MKAAWALCALIPFTAAVQTAAQTAAQTVVETSPAPQERPDPEERLPEFEPLSSPETAPAAVARGVAQTLAEDDATFAACLAELDAFGTQYDVVDAISEPDDADCGIVRPVMVSHIVPGVALQPDARMRCDTAARLAEWMVGSVQPAAALMQSRGEVVQVDHGSTYICRRRNNAPDGKLSEHAFGNAVDVMGFRFEDGTSLAIEPRADAGTIEEGFQRAVRGTACLSFTTVLGPGTDAAHADHLHLDVKARNGGYRICQ